jgi:uroporphyrin-III C-methyltransferase/precorrin-2 dehydrogenase/sirohydrochlorin ferrochelatase
MEHLPIFLDVASKPALVVGAGDVAARKARMLLKAGARPVVVTAAAQGVEGCKELESMAGRGEVELHRRPFTSADLSGCVLAFVATDQQSLQVRVADAARAAGIPLTHRDHAHAMTIVTGHERDGEPDVDWAAPAPRTAAI